MLRYCPLSLRERVGVRAAHNDCVEAMGGLSLGGC